MSLTQQKYINSLIYLHPDQRQPTRYQMIRLSSWRVYMHQQLQSFQINDVSKLIKINLNSRFPELFSNENKAFYDFLTGQSIDNTDDSPDYLDDAYRQDLISHFICRMLYCQDQKTQDQFVNYQRTILQIRLRKSKHTISRLKKVVELLSKIQNCDFSVPEQQWNHPNYRHQILQGTVIYDKEKAKDKKNLTINDFAKIPFEFAEAGVKRRRCFIYKGYVYAHNQVLIDIILSLYGDYLRAKLEKTKKNVAQLLENDSENQLKYFLLKSLDVMNQTSQKQIEVQSGQKLTLKNVESYWNKFFPPCMLHLTQALKAKGHLRHDGRRQLWLFFKGCGMNSLDNQEFFRKHMGQKVSDSEMKGHIYNIQHAYGQVGKRQPQNPKICRNIITGAPPKKDEYHGCPFKHWNNTELALFLKTRYKISEQNLNKIMSQKQENRFQIACGNLFESVDVNTRYGKIPQDISSKLGKSPHSYFQAGMQIQFKIQKQRQNKQQTKNTMMNIQF